MKKAILSLVTTMASGAAAQTGDLDLDPRILAEELSAHVHYLASDRLEGRGVGSDGFYEAARYGASAFQAAGALPVAGGDSDRPYLHAFDVPVGVLNRVSQGHTQPVVSYNVVAMVRGSNPQLRDQFVFITAHLDHLGLRDGQIYNGANDNATGSAAVIELAESMANNPPARSVVFVLFGAEEVGLVGSTHMARRAPPVRLESVVALLNIDGVGYYVNQRPREVRLLGLTNRPCSAFPEYFYRVATEHGATTLDRDDGGSNMMQRSDQAPFVEAGVPSVMFTDYGGGPGIYHTPYDDAGSLHYDKLASMVQMVDHVARAFANTRDEGLCH